MIEQLLSSADLDNMTDRLMLSDELEAEGRIVEAKALRDKDLKCVLVDGLIASLCKAEAFFWDNDGNTNPFLRLKAAQKLAEAEDWKERAKCFVEWFEDADADRSWLDEGDSRPLFGCVVWHGDEHQSLWGIDLGPEGDLNDPYRRVVEAELALELLEP